jgi:2-C-methyl-D-erythritol 4-phosphate cytidylyltransferase
MEGALAASRVSGAATAAVPVVPTIKEARRRWVVRTLDRRSLWEIQTPQVFRRDLLEKAHAKARTNGAGATDDAILVEKLGVRVRVALGSHRNIKVTTKEDLGIAELFLRNAHRHRV